MPGAHIAGMPIEETLLSLGGPAVIYVILLGVALRRVGDCLRAVRRHNPF